MCKLIFSQEEEPVELEQVVEWLRTLKPTESSDTLQVKILRQIAKAYAYLFEELETQKSTLPKLVDELNQILENKGYQRGGEKKLANFLGWVGNHARDDVVTVATIALIGVIRHQAFQEGNHRTGQLLQNFLLMSGGYPPMHINELDTYKKIDDDKKSHNVYLRGIEIRQLMKFLFESMATTMENFVFKVEQKKEEEKGEEPSGSGAEVLRADADRRRTMGLFSPVAVSGPFELVRDESAAVEKSLLETGEPKRKKFKEEESAGESVEELEEVLEGGESLSVEMSEEGILETVESTSKPPPPIIGWHTLFKEALKGFNEELLKLPVFVETEEEIKKKKEFKEKFLG